MRLKRYFLILFLLFFAAAGYARTAKTVRVVFFSDEYTTDDAMQNAFQKALLAGGADYSIENVEILPALFNSDSYIINLPPGFDGRILENANFYYRSTGGADIVKNRSSLILQQPRFDGNIKNFLLEDSNHPSLGATAARARRALMILKDGPSLDVISTETPRITGAWVPGLCVNYYLTNSYGPTTVTVFDKPAGGIGAWYDAVNKTVKESPSKPLVINTGGIDAYHGIIQDADFLTEYWKAMNLDIVAPSAKDIDVLWELLGDIPRDSELLLASNINPAEDSVQNLFTQMRIIERGGVKTGVFSLVEENSLDAAPGRGVPFRASDPSEAAKKALAYFKENNADFVILISHLQQRTLSRILPNMPGIDMVINGRAQNSSGVRRSRVELDGWRRESSFMPSYISQNNAFTLGDVKITFARDRQGFTPTLIEDSPPTNIFAANTFVNRFYDINRKLFTSSAKQGDALLPGARRASKAYGGEIYISYTPLEFFNMAAAIIKEKTKSEASFVKIQPFSQNFFGALTQAEIIKWLGPDEEILTAKVTGAELKSMLRFTDFTPPFGGNVKDYAAGLNFASAGIKKDGDKYLVNGLAVNDDELYAISFPASLTQERFALPFLRNQGAASVKPSGINLHQAVIGRLTDIKEKTAAEAGHKFSEYKKDYDLRREAELPPQTEIEEELDFKLETMGPLAVEEYFLNQLQDAYLGEITALMANKPVIRPMWRLNLRSLALQITNTDVRNADLYQNSSESRIKADSQTLIQGRLNLALEYYKERIRWDNILFMEYGRMSIRPPNKESYTSESVDQITLSSEYTYKSFDIKNFIGGFLAGPFFSLAYQTEFTSPNERPRHQAVRGKGGLRLFEGAYLKELYLATGPELDFTYSDTATKYSWEFGFKVEHPVNTKSKAIYRAMIRDFFITKNTTRGNDLSYEFELDARLQMELFRKFSIAPFATYYQAESKSIGKPASNLFVGVALSYSRLFKSLPF